MVLKYHCTNNAYNHRVILIPYFSKLLISVTWSQPKAAHIIYWPQSPSSFLKGSVKWGEDFTYILGCGGTHLQSTQNWQGCMKYTIWFCLSIGDNKILSFPCISQWVQLLSHNAMTVLHCYMRYYHARRPNRKTMNVKVADKQNTDVGHPTYWF